MAGFLASKSTTISRSGEAADVSDETVHSWKEQVKTIMEEYEARDIWNFDETGCFYRALPEKTLAQKKSNCKGGEKAKQRLTIAFIANAVGEKESPIVIGKAAKPRCFKGIRIFKFLIIPNPKPGCPVKLWRIFRRI